MRLRRSGAAKADLTDVLYWSLATFGEAGLRRYRALIDRALRDIAADPQRLGSRAREDLGEGVRVYHLRHSRRRLDAPQRVRFPRHLLVYRVVDRRTVVVGRILHDAMDPGRHVTAGAFEA